MFVFTERVVQVSLRIRNRVSACVLLLAALAGAFAVIASAHAHSGASPPPGQVARVLAGDPPPVITGKGHEP
jgi:uncharacterized membrane protein